MDKWEASVLVLFVFLVPVSCKEFFFSEPITCYCLDGILIIYCLIATAFYFREKYSHLLPVTVEVPPNQEGNDSTYQELQGPKDADPYQVLEPTKRKKKGGKKRKPQSTQAEQREVDLYESLGATAPPLSPR